MSVRSPTHATSIVSTPLAASAVPVSQASSSGTAAASVSHALENASCQDFLTNSRSDVWCLQKKTKLQVYLPGTRLLQ